jgi:hypothetical protein
MKRRLDSIIIGGAMLFGGMAHRRAGHVARQIDDLEEAVEAVEAELREAPAAAERPAIPGMPLPTGYGLQVRGPDDENIVLPVCLPPGFELASMVLTPEFLPRESPQPAAAPAATPAPARVAAPAPAPAPAPVPAGERLTGTRQYVFDNEPDFSADETFGGAIAAEDARKARTAGVETHRL